MKRLKVIAVEGLWYVVSGQWHRSQANAKMSLCNTLIKAFNAHKYGMQTAKGNSRHH